MRLATIVVLAGLFVSVSSKLEAAPITLRSTLNSMLGAGAVNENFETYAISSGFALLGGSTDSTSTENGQGPGLVVPGIVLSTTTGNVIWQANGFYSMPTKTIGTDVSGDLTVDFTTSVNAFGVDLLNYGGYPSTYNVTIFGADDTTVLASGLGLSFPSAVTPQFFGFENAGGIGSFRVDRLTGFGPVIDNLEFGSAKVPEPGSLVLVLTGLAAMVRRARRPRQAD
jgi:hypothetical protein